MANHVSQQDQPVRSADRVYYASGQKSAITRTMADSTLKDPNELKPIPTPKLVQPRASRSADTSLPADVYYANAPAEKMLKAAGRVASSCPVRRAATRGIITIAEELDVIPGVEAAIARVLAGESPVRIAVASAELLSRVRLQVDYAVTREKITEEQGRDIVFGQAGSSKAEKEPATIPQVADAPSLNETEAFVAPDVEDMEDVEEATSEDDADLGQSDEGEATLDKEDDAVLSDEDED